MNKSDFESGIRKVWEFARTLGLGHYFINPASLSASDKFRDLALDPSCTYEDLYLAGLENGDYNIQLSDFSFLQFGFGKEHHVRYAYYPNPFIGTSSAAVLEVNELKEYVEEGLVTIEEYLHRIADIRNGQHPPMTRYENAPDDYKEFAHPCSHLHFGHHTENRWQLQKALTPLAFSLLIFKHYYSDFWQKETSVKIFERDGSPESFLESERSECRILPSELFSESEGRTFAFV